jgi:hypothetical protein
MNKEKITMKAFKAKSKKGEEKNHLWSEKNRTKSSKNWTDYMANESVSLNKSNRPVCMLCFKTISNAETLLKKKPNAADALLTQEPKLVEFPNGNGALIFPLKNISDLDNLIDLVFEGPFDETVYLINGMVSGLPKEKHARFLGSIGISKGFNIENVLGW